jgi:hypothetical protein
VDCCPECGFWLGRGTRSDQQNKAIHLFCRLLADALNDAGLDVRKTMKQDFDVPWNETLVKELIWKEVQKAMFNKKSTTQLSKTEVGDVYEVINRNIAERHGVYVPFPSEEIYGKR